MITVSSFNPAATGVAFGQSAENKSVGRVKPAALRAGEELVEQTAKRPSFVHNMVEGGKTFVKRAAFVLALGTAAIGCGKDPVLDKPPAAAPNDFAEMMKNSYGMNEAEALTGKFDTIALQADNNQIIGLKSLGKSGDSTLVRQTIPSNKAGKADQVVIYKYFKNPGDADGTLSLKLSSRLDGKGPFVDSPYIYKAVNKDKITTFFVNGAEFMRGKAIEMGKLIEQTWTEDGSQYKGLFKRIK